MKREYPVNKATTFQKIIAEASKGEGRHVYVTRIVSSKGEEIKLDHYETPLMELLKGDLSGQYTLVYPPVVTFKEEQKIDICFDSSRETSGTVTLKVNQGTTVNDLIKDISARIQD